jgi:DNA mismatch endonuclease (patch repair protein)
VAKTNASFWAEKVRSNRQRDVETDRLLADEGWLVIRAWEHDSPTEVAALVAQTVQERRL